MILKNWNQIETNIMHNIYAAVAKSLQLCPTLFNSIDGLLLGSSVPGFLQARTLECVAISFSNAWKWKVKVKSLSRVWLLATPWTAAHQAPSSMGFSRQEYWSGVPLPSPLACIPVLTLRSGKGTCLLFSFNRKDLDLKFVSAISCHGGLGKSFSLSKPQGLT